MNRPIKLTFLKTGLLTLVVDNTSVGYQKYGVPVGGPMDAKSAGLANWLVGNTPNTSLFEINIGGPQIRFETDCQIAITGADISPTINGIGAAMYETRTLKRGEALKFGKLNEGCRAYLAISGSWNVSDWMNTDSPKSSQTLKNLSSIEIKPTGKLSPYRKVEKPKLSESPVIIRAIQGPEFELLPEYVSKILLNSTFELLSASNRMGYRLSPNLPKIGTSIISSAVVPGTLQITQEGYPILLMQDAPATGGYVRALNVISEDMPNLGQLKAGDSFKFNLFTNI